MSVPINCSWRPAPTTSWPTPIGIDPISTPSWSRKPFGSAWNTTTKPHSPSAILKPTAFRWPGHVTERPSKHAPVSWSMPAALGATCIRPWVCQKLNSKTSLEPGRNFRILPGWVPGPRTTGFSMVLPFLRMMPPYTTPLRAAGCGCCASITGSPALVLQKWRIATSPAPSSRPKPGVFSLNGFPPSGASSPPLNSSARGCAPSLWPSEPPDASGLDGHNCLWLLGSWTRSFPRASCCRY